MGFQFSKSGWGATHKPKPAPRAIAKPPETFIIAFPVAFLTARNMTFNVSTWMIGRFILVASRSVNTVVWGLLFVAIFGVVVISEFISATVRGRIS